MKQIDREMKQNVLGRCPKGKVRIHPQKHFKGPGKAGLLNRLPSAEGRSEPADSDFLIAPQERAEPRGAVQG